MFHCSPSNFFSAVSNTGHKARGGPTQLSMSSHVSHASYASGTSSQSRASKLSHTEKLEAKAQLKSEQETLHMKNVLRNYF